MSDGVLDLAKLQALLDAMPPKETLLSSRLFPSDKAIVAKGKRENFTVAHPAFWARIEVELRRRADRVTPFDASPVRASLFGLQIIETDPWDGDSDETAKWRRGHLVRFAEALAHQAGIDVDPFGWKAMAKFGFDVPGAKGDRK